MKHLSENSIHHGRSEELLKKICPESVSLSFWSPPYFVGKEYERGETYDSWQKMLRAVIAAHTAVLKPGGFMVINIADILCFKDESIPRFQGMNISRQKSLITRQQVLEARAKHPQFNRDKLAALLGCSEQTIDRRLNGNNIRGGKYETQTRVKLVGGSLEEYAYEVGLYLYDRRIWVKDAAWANSRWISNTLKAVDEFEDLYVYWKPGQQTIDRGRLTEREWKEWGVRGVWHIDSVRVNDNHEAKFPLALADRVIRLYTDPHDLVLDPFLGSGTTAIAALKAERRYLGIDKEKKYVSLARKSVEDATRQGSLSLQAETIST